MMDDNIQNIRKKIISVLIIINYCSCATLTKQSDSQKNKTIGDHGKLESYNFTNFCSDSVECPIMERLSSTINDFKLIVNNILFSILSKLSVLSSKEITKKFSYLDFQNEVLKPSNIKKSFDKYIPGDNNSELEGVYLTDYDEAILDLKSYMNVNGPVRSGEFTSEFYNTSVNGSLIHSHNDTQGEFPEVIPGKMIILWY